jgi:MSHA pilin protein MshA
MSRKEGFTLVELVMVIAIIGILASIAIPKFQDMSGAAKVAATKAGLGSVRSTLAVQYANSATAGTGASYPAALTTAHFAGSELPKNQLNGFTGVTALSTTTTGTATHASMGYWYVTNSTAPANIYGKAGAYSESTGVTDTTLY